MDFPFDVNNLFADGISLIDRNLTPYRSTYETLRRRRDELRKVIDEMGQASAKAQSLHGPITSASRLAQSSHHLYIKKDASANNGNGAVVGFIKVGKKKLFVYDGNGVQHEMEPLCVLDFYVCESCQRQGSGRQLFDFMLARENVKPVELAIDRPSQKCLSFLSRHYSLCTTIPQVNNFVIFEGFLKYRFGLRQCSQLNQNKTSYHNYETQGTFGSTNEQNHPFDDRNFAERGDEVGDFKTVHSRFGGRQNSDTDGISLIYVTPVVSSASGSRPQSGRMSQPSSGLLFPPQNQLPTVGMSAHQALYSRHFVSSPLANDEGITSFQTTSNGNITLQKQYRASPPLLSRNGPPTEYLKMTGNNNYMDRRGHLRVDAYNPSYSLTTNSYEIKDPRRVQGHRQDTSFNIFGIPKLPLQSVNTNLLPYKKTALW